jgi:endogenous inhibitor of DNA gyrase (YacG/DUF329 family)
MDLGRWFTGVYSVPSEELSDGPDVGVKDQSHREAGLEEDY